MANSNRSPKELKDFIEKSKNTALVEWRPEANKIEWAPRTSKVDWAPRVIRKDAKVICRTEYEVMLARLEEQSRLIMYYKQRGDDYLLKNQSLEKLNLYLAEQKPFKFFRIDSR